VNVPTRIILFGAISGLFWSLVPIFFVGRAVDVAVLCLITGVITGVLLSLALCKLLPKCNRWGTVLLGIITLPVGVFCFGVFISVIFSATHFITGGAFPSADYEYSLNPFKVLTLAVLSGLMYASTSVYLALTTFMTFLFPSAVLTTYLLRLTVLGRSNKSV
jgi:hypothetical protein